MQIRVSFIFFFLVLFQFSFAQKILNFLPSVDSSAPEWANLMYEEKPNVWKVDKAYQAYYEHYSFEKTIHTQFYKKWRRKVEPHINEEGWIEMPTLNDLQNEEDKYRNLLRNAVPNSRNNNSWQCLGPFETYSTDNDQVKVSWQANIYSIDVAPSDANVLFCGTESGGIFKTTDKGLNWMPASFNALFKTITSIEIHPTDWNIVYAGDGQQIYKTTDAGDSWESVLAINDLSVNDIAIHPTEPDILLAATRQGLYRTENAGSDWTQILTDICYDIELKPDNPDVVYVLKNNPTAIRTEFFKSSDQGQTFNLKDSGWYSSTNPTREDHGARMTVTPADPDRIYAVLIGNSKPGDNGFIGVYHSIDGGESWTLPSGQVGGPWTSDHPNLMTLNNTNTLYQGFYNLGIAASHTDADDVLIGGLNLWRTQDGAQNYTPLGGYQGNVGWIHPDQQEIVVHGNDMWLANDGGINYSTDLFSTHESRKNGILATDFWGFGSGWNEDLLVGGRYHNGNTAFRPSFTDGAYLRLGGAEAPTGYVNPGLPGKTYFSDVSTKIIPHSLSGAVVNLPQLSKYPSESYFSAHSSELEYDPSCYKCFYIGNDHQLWYTEDEGRSFELIKSFGSSGNPVIQFEVSRSNPQVIYVYQRTSFYGATLWKTEDGGVSWASKTFPNASSQRAGVLAMSATDENTLWVGFAHQNNDGAKIFKSMDGGDSWENQTTSTLDGQTIHAILHQAGTDGGIYLGTNYAVFYRDSSMDDWMIYNEGLPLRTNSNLLRPFYKESKMRLATYGNGIWEVPFFAPSPPLAQPMVDKRSSFCARDTFYFEDYSILDHNDATWAWDFPGADYVSANDIRNPQVVYGIPGTYDVTLTVTQGNMSSTKTISQMVTVTPECEADRIAGNALELPGGVSDFASLPPLHLNTNTFSITAWVRRKGPQNPWAGLVFCRGGSTTVGFNLGENHELRYHWNDGEWWWDSGQVLPDDEWTHVALVIEPSRATIYMNGIPSEQVVSHSPEAFDADITIGADPNFDLRRFKGLIDEVTIWNKALSQNEIRELRHLTLKPYEHPELVTYFQFNRAEGVATDRVGVNHASIGGAGARVLSSAPVGGGFSQRMSINGGGFFDFPATGLSFHFPDIGIVPEGEVVVSRLDVFPFSPPDTTLPGEVYWIANNYGINEEFAPLTDIHFKDIGTVTEEEQNEPAYLKLFQRGDNRDDNWDKKGAATVAVSGEFGSASFAIPGELNQMGQFVIARTEDVPTSLTIPERLFPYEFIVYPNPLSKSGSIYIETNFKENYHFSIYDIQGKRIFQQELEGNVQLPNLQLESGAYFYRIETGERIFNGLIEVIL